MLEESCPSAVWGVGRKKGGGGVGVFHTVMLNQHPASILKRVQAGLLIRVCLLLVWYVLNYLSFSDKSSSQFFCCLRACVCPMSLRSLASSQVPGLAYHQAAPTQSEQQM